MPLVVEKNGYEFEYPDNTPYDVIDSDMEAFFQKQGVTERIEDIPIVDEAGNVSFGEGGQVDTPSTRGTHGLLTPRTKFTVLTPKST